MGTRTHVTLFRKRTEAGLTCPVVQEADASVVMGGDGEGLAGVTHHLVDLHWAWEWGQVRSEAAPEAEALACVSHATPLTTAPT